MWPGSRRCWRSRRPGRSGCGRSRVVRASASTSPFACSTVARLLSTCRRSCRRGCGSMRPGRAARLMTPTRTRWPWPGSGWRGVYARKKAANKELVELVRQTGTGLLALHGIGPSGAARLLVEVGDITRFPAKGHFASWTGTAPIDASSGDNVRHRLSRGGNRQINMTLHMMAVVQLPTRTTHGRAYYDRKVAAGKTPNKAMRCLKRRLSDIVYRTMLDDMVANKVTGPGGHRGASLQPSAAGSHPHTGSSDKSLPGPATTKSRTPLRRAS